MAKKYLDYDGLLYFWQKIKTTFAMASHTHTKSEITDFPTTMTPSSHTHGNIQNGGTLQTTDVAVANGDKLVITDASGSNKIARSSVVFDGETETQALTKKGTWATFNNYVHPSTTAHSASAVKVGNDASGHVVLGDALKTSDLTNDSGFITIEDVPEGVAPTTTTPKMDGTASVGTETKYAKGDHVHPSDTSRVPTTRKVNGKALSADVDLYFADVKTSASDNTTLASALGNKVDKVTGKGLSTEDYTTAEKNKLANIIEDANFRITSETEISGQGINGTSYAFYTSYGSHEGNTTDWFYDADYIDSMGTQMATALGNKVDSSSIGQASGVCPLDANSKVDAQYLPSYVDDVIEAYARSGQTALSSTWLATGSASGTVITPETGKIYVLMADSGDYSANTQFRWSGTTYVKLADGGVSSITNAEIDTILAS